MADEIDDLEIELAEDGGSKIIEPEVVVEDKGAEGAPKDDVGATLAALRQQLDAERSRASEAERRAAAAQQDAHQSRSEKQDTDLHLITNAIETVKQNSDILKANLRAAIIAQDIDLQADIQSEMSTNAARLMQLEQGKQALESAPKPEAPQPYANDPVETLASQLTPRSAAWVRAHPEYATDPNKNRKMLAAHNLAVADGIAPDSDDYFASVEETLRIRKASVQQEESALSEAAAPSQRRAAPPAAPVSRESGNGPGTAPNRVRLSAEEREMAEMSGLTVQEYAQNKLALQRAGKLN